MKMTKFLQYLESRGKFRKKKSAKYIQVYIYIYISAERQFYQLFITFMRIFCILLKLSLTAILHLLANFSSFLALFSPFIGLNVTLY